MNGACPRWLGGRRNTSSGGWELEFLCLFVFSEEVKVGVRTNVRGGEGGGESETVSECSKSEVEVADGNDAYRHREVLKKVTSNRAVVSSQ